MELYNFIDHEACINLADEEHIDEIIERLKEELDQRKNVFIEGKRSGINLTELQKTWKQILIVFNGVSSFTQSERYTLIVFAETIMKDYFQLKVCVIGIDTISEMSSNYDVFAKLLQNEQSAILFNSIREQNLFNIKVPYNYKENLTSITDGYRITGNNFINARFGFEEA
jgi:S-DNA-T family DNA segregation ATPase FtsK/SpoIIIE